MRVEMRVFPLKMITSLVGRRFTVVISVIGAFAFHRITQQYDYAEARQPVHLSTNSSPHLP